MQVLTRPAPRLWPEQYTLVGGVPPTHAVHHTSADKHLSFSKCVHPLLQHNQYTNEDVQCISWEAQSQAYGKSHMPHIAIREAQFRDLERWMAHLILTELLAA